MGSGRDLVPFHEIPGSVCAEYRVRRVFHIAVGVIACGGEHFLGVVAGVIPGGQHGPAAQTMGVGRNLAGIAAGRSHRQAAGQPHGIAQRLRRVKAAAHPLHIGHGAAQRVGG